MNTKQERQLQKQAIMVECEAIMARTNDPNRKPAVGLDSGLMNDAMRMIELRMKLDDINAQEQGCVGCSIM